MKNISYIESFEQWKKAFTFFIPIRIRFSETDMFGHVNNRAAFIYFEEARISLLESMQLYHHLDESNTIPVVADLQCDYHTPIYFGETIHVYVKVHKIGESSFDLHYLAVNENETVCLTGRGSIVNIDRKTEKPLPFTTEAIETLQLSRK